MNQILATLAPPADHPDHRTVRVDNKVIIHHTINKDVVHQVLGEMNIYHPPRDVYNYTILGYTGHTVDTACVGCQFKDEFFIMTLKAADLFVSDDLYITMVTESENQELFNNVYARCARLHREVELKFSPCFKVPVEG